MRRALSLALLIAATVWTTSSQAAAPEVRYAHGHLTADVRDVDLADLLDAIAAKAGFEIRGKPAARTVSFRADATPVPEAVSRLLEGQRVAYTYDRRGGLKRVEFFEVGSDAAPPAVTQPAPADGGSPSGIAARDRLVPVEGRLAGALGASQSTFSQIVGVALQVGDARLRKEALRVALGLLDADPDLRADVSRTLDEFDDAALAARLEEIAGAHAEDTALQTARMAHWKPLRRRAVAVLRLIRSGG